MSASPGPLDPTMVHSGVEAGLVATMLTPRAFHFYTIYLGDVDVTRSIVLANIRLGCVKRYGPFEKILAPVK